MTITLPPNQQEWLEKQVAAGLYESVDAAAEAAIDFAIVESALSHADDLSWVKPYLDVAYEELARGEGISLDEHKRRMAEKFKSLLDR